jgi:GR25 family glycosyltransferase involved in LPS biosynthesis
MIPHIFWINLERSKDRKDAMEKQFSDNCLVEFQTRIEAVDGETSDFSTLMVNDISKICARRGEIACSLSHLKAIQLAYINGLEEVLILEDDARFTEDDLNRLRNILNDPEVKNMEILQLAWIIGDQQHIVDKIFGAHSERKTSIPFEIGIYSTAAYYINKNGMQSVLKKHFNEERKLFDLSGCALGNFIQADYIIMGINSKVHSIVLPVFTYDPLLPSLIHNENIALHNYSLTLIEKLKASKI